MLPSMALLACPFCRSLYTQGEERQCPECGVALVPMHGLPLSHDAELEELPQPVLPEDEILPWAYWRRGRGALLFLALLGLVTFLLPWVELFFPDHEVRSGFDLARGRAGWLWGGAAAWLVLVPLVGSRRTISRMRGVRPITALFSAMTFAEVVMLTWLRPTAPASVPMRFEWGYGLYLSGAVSLLATAVAFRFGGALPPLPRIATPSESSSTLH
jgi:hypothetical protein